MARPKTTGKPEYTIRVFDAIARLHAARLYGATQSEVARETGLPLTTVRRHIRRLAEVGAIVYEPRIERSLVPRPGWDAERVREAVG